MSNSSNIVERTHLSTIINMTDSIQPTTPDSPSDAACCGGATSKLSPDEAAALAHRLAAVADPVRLQMLSIMAGSSTGEVCACDFVGPIAKSQPTVSHHLKVLTEAGLIEGDKRGRWIWYRLAAGSIDGLVSSLAAATD